MLEPNVRTAENEHGGAITKAILLHYKVAVTRQATSVWPTPSLAWLLLNINNAKPRRFARREMAALCYKTHYKKSTHSVSNPYGARRNPMRDNYV